jgi:hypothetical protein
MSISANSFMAGYTGCRMLTGTSLITEKFRGFVVNADAVISVLTDKNGNNLMTSIGLTGVTITQGQFISVPDGNYINTIQLASGSVILYYE